MDNKNKSLIVSGISAGIGGALGAVSGSSSWIVVAVVSLVFGVFAAWSINGLVK